MLVYDHIIYSFISAGTLKLFSQLEKSNLVADSYSLTAALCACGQLNRVKDGKSLHSKIEKYGAECSVFVANAATLPVR